MLPSWVKSGVIWPILLLLPFHLSILLFWEHSVPCLCPISCRTPYPVVGFVFMQVMHVGAVGTWLAEWGQRPASTASVWYEESLHGEATGTGYQWWVSVVSLITFVLLSFSFSMYLCSLLLLSFPHFYLDLVFYFHSFSFLDFYRLSPIFISHFYIFLWCISSLWYSPLLYLSAVSYFRFFPSISICSFLLSISLLYICLLSFTFILPSI